MVGSSSPALRLIFLSSHGTSNMPPMPASTMNAPSRPRVPPTEVLWSPIWISELRIVSITIATTSSSTATPMASWPGFSCVAPISCSTLLMIAELDTMTIAARKVVSIALQPKAPPKARVRLYITMAPVKVASTSDRPSRRSFRRLKPMPMENIRNTRPTDARVSIRGMSVTSENGGVCGPITTPASR